MGPHRNPTRPLQEEMWELQLVEGRPWSPATHGHYPRAFRAAARLLLLAAHAGGGGGGCGCQLGRLPPQLLERIIRESAAPLGAWAREAVGSVGPTAVGAPFGDAWREMPYGAVHDAIRPPTSG
jgi:hypothetical protein